MLTDSEKECALSRQMYEDASGNPVPLTVWRNLVKDGCCYCKAVPDAADAKWCGWDTVTGEPVCVSCMDEFNGADADGVDGDDDNNETENEVCLGV